MSFRLPDSYDRPAPVPEALLSFAPVLEQHSFYLEARGWEKNPARGTLNVMRDGRKLGYYNGSVHAVRDGRRAVMGYHSDYFPTKRGKAQDGIQAGAEAKFTKWFCEKFGCDGEPLRFTLGESRGLAYPEIVDADVVLRVLLADAGIDAPAPRDNAHRGDLITLADGRSAARHASPPAADAPAPKRPEDILADDLAGITAAPAAGPTETSALIKARLGQGDFRRSVLSMWGGQCAVTGSDTLEAIRASHVKPWRGCSDSERRDPNNGLPLVATLDALFDAWLITFSESGEMLVSPELDDGEKLALGLVHASLRRPVSEATAKYLARHRAIFLQRNASREGQ